MARIGETPGTGTQQVDDAGASPDLKKLTNDSIKRDKGAAPIDQDPSPNEVDPEPAQNVYAK